MNSEPLRQKELGKTLLNKLVRFNHERNGGPVHRVHQVNRDGMIELEDMDGLFAPHLITIVDDIGGIPLSPPPLKCPGVGRDKDNICALQFYFSRPVSDDEMRFLHDGIKRAVACMPKDSRQ